MGSFERALSVHVAYISPAVRSQYCCMQTKRWCKTSAEHRCPHECTYKLEQRRLWSLKFTWCRHTVESHLHLTQYRFNMSLSTVSILVLTLVGVLSTSAKMRSNSTEPPGYGDDGLHPSPGSVSSFNSQFILTFHYWFSKYVTASYKMHITINKNDTYPFNELPCWWGQTAYVL